MMVSYQMPVGSFRRWTAVVSGLLCCLVAAGCGGAPDDRPDLGNVSGTVTLDGEALEGATITFLPESSGRPAYGVTDAEGYYEVKYTADVMGAKIGKNLVAIRTYQPPVEEGDDPTPERVPVQYNRDNADNPEMTVEVTSGSNTFNFELSSEGEIHEPDEEEE